MKKLLFPLVAALLFIMAACGTDNASNGDGGNQGGNDDQTQHQTDQNDNGDDQVTDEPEDLTDEEIQALIEQLDFYVSVKPEKDQTTFTMELLNTGEETIELGFSSGQQYEIVVTDPESGDEIYRYSKGKAFTEAFVYKPVEPGEALSWTETWAYEGDIEPGSYQAEVTLLPAQINKQVIDAKPFVKDFTFAIPDEAESTAFRNVEVEGTNGKYKVTGEARVFEGVFMYNVEDGHQLLVEDTPVQVGEGAPSWSEFEIEIDIPEDQLPVNGTLTLVLYEGSAKDGTPTNQVYVSLEQIIQ
ncbi:MAG: hypothetical protein H0Z32_07310 [Bacillaceae bacterium]|nr:hypothetical protein [Bacillaceae bacterium]